MYDLVTQTLETIGQDPRQVVEALGDGPNPLGAMIDGIHSRHNRQEDLSRADIRSGLLPADMLLPGLKGHTEGRIPVDVLGNPNNPSRHLPLESLVGSQIGSVRATKSHGDTEALGVTSENVAEMVNSDQIIIRRLLGTEGEFGQADLGLDADFVVTVLSAVGNYGEIYDRYMGPDGAAFTLPRAQNELWSNGGLIYAPPMK